MPSKIPLQVVHVSGQDENHKATELNHHSPSTQGWQSGRFCLYPQDIVVQLNKRSRIMKLQILSHQYLIATKIEFYVGDVPEGMPPSLQNARYTRLGYIALADNEKTDFKARELKSVQVDANGLFIKFVIHKNHVNRHNIYNQVGIVAVNVIGEDVYGDYSNKPDDAHGLNKPDFISPLDDLAFDMYQDPEVAQIIRKLDAKKQEAVLQERYEFAKKLKQAIQDLQKAGEKLGKFDVEKRMAVANEDYDKAQIKKLQMDEFRITTYKNLGIQDLLELQGSRYPANQPSYQEPQRQPSPANLPELTGRSNYSPPPPPRTPYDDRPLPAIKSEPDTTPAPATVDTSGTVTGEAEPMSEKDQREATLIIEVFGMPLASNAYSKMFSFREDALKEVMKQMESMSPATTSKDDARQAMRAATQLAVKLNRDKVLSVFEASLALQKFLFLEFVPKFKIPKGETITTVEKTIPGLLTRTGETAPRPRAHAMDYVIDLSTIPEVKPLHVVTGECVKPFKLNAAPRLAQSRTELVHRLYNEHKLDNSGLTLDNMMGFCTVAIQHTSGNVRMEAEDIIIAMYKDIGAPVKSFLPPDDDKTRKNVLYKKLFEEFDKIDGKPSKGDVKKQKADKEAEKEREIKELKAQLDHVRDINAGKKPMDESLLNDEPKEKKKAAAAKKGKDSTTPKDAPNADVAAAGDKTCIFCGEVDDSFTSDGLDLHYWKNCPMLKRCQHCKQVEEISGLTQHLLQDCTNKDKFYKCPKCTEAIDKQDTNHDCVKTAEKNMNHCPLCHENFPQGEDGWYKHLMGKDGCKQNPRRKDNKGKGKNKGKIPVKANTSKATPRK